MGFPYNENRVRQGTEAVVWLRHHWEANHIVSGTGEVTDLTAGQTWKLEPGMSHSVGPKDRHRLHAVIDMHLAAMFCPPLVGNEQHDKDGALAPSGPVPLGSQGH